MVGGALPGAFPVGGSEMTKWIVAGLSLVGAGSASAEVPAAITAAISTMQADGVTVATAFVVATIAVAAVKFLRSAR